MALAYLQYRGAQNDNHLFHADIGTAKYFRYVLGKQKKRLKIGKHEFIEVVDGEKRKSRLQAINPAMQKIGDGKFPLLIPLREIDYEHRFIQLHSFPSLSIKIPTISNILRIYPVSRRSQRIGGVTLSSSLSTEYIKEYKMQDTIVKNKAFNYQEPQLSQVMFWNTIVKALPTIVKHAAPIIGGLLKPGDDSSANQDTDSSSNKTTEVINKVVEVLETIAGNSAETTGNAATSETTPTTTETPTAGEATPATEQPITANVVEQPTQSLHGISAGRLSSSYSLEADTLLGLRPILEKILSPEAIAAIGDEPQKLFMAIRDAVIKTEPTNTPVNSASDTAQDTSKENFSKAKVAPALLAALPALMPVIEKALNPEIIEAVGNQPVKLFKAIGDAVLKMNEQELKHLEAINPGVDSADDIAKLLQGMSLSASKHKEDIIKFKMIKNLNLEFIDTKTVQFKNKDRVLYSKNHRIAIPFKISSSSGSLNKILKRSIIQILIKDAESMELVFRKNVNLLDVDISEEINEAFLTVEELKGIPCNKELKFELSHIWKSNKNKNIGVFKSHYVHFIETYIFDRLGEQVGDPILLNDINIYRNYWHKIWEGGFSQSKRWEVAFDLKYYYLLNLEEKDIARLETRKSVTDDNAETGQEHPSRRKVRAKLKSGTELGFNAMNTLLTLFKQPVLDQSILKILEKSTIEASFQQVSRIHLEMKGRDGDTATLWSYPEMSLYKLHMSKIGDVDPHGQVINLNQIDRVIPKANFIHFLGTTSEH